MKKNVSFVGAALMALSFTLAACGGKKADTTPVAPEPNPCAANPCGTENPCAPAENPCGANPCGGENPCGG